MLLQLYQAMINVIITYMYVIVRHQNTCVLISLWKVDRSIEYIAFVLQAMTFSTCSYKWQRIIFLHLQGFGAPMDAALALHCHYAWAAGAGLYKHVECTQHASSHAVTYQYLK